MTTAKHGNVFTGVEGVSPTSISGSNTLGANVGGQLLVSFLIVVVWDAAVMVWARCTRSHAIGAQLRNESVTAVVRMVVAVDACRGSARDAFAGVGENMPAALIFHTTGDKYETHG
ncbi:hypothetical protein BU17DRAFT_69941 [Hysterangium stoloniferum]|nr:hypothetical protein BU17DRAFT_69941 [Hysterangium stoloniferum]